MHMACLILWGTTLGTRKSKIGSVDEKGCRQRATATFSSTFLSLFVIFVGELSVNFMYSMIYLRHVEELSENIEYSMTFLRLVDKVALKFATYFSSLDLSKINLSPPEF